MEVKSKSEVTQLCPTLSDSMDCTHQAPLSVGFSRQELEWGAIAFSVGIFLVRDIYIFPVKL